MLSARATACRVWVEASGPRISSTSARGSATEPAACRPSWATPEGIKTRIDVAAQLGRQAAGAVADPRALVEEVLGPLASAQTRQAVARAVSKPQALALLLMSPEFQRR